MKQFAVFGRAAASLVELEPQMLREVVVPCLVEFLEDKQGENVRFLRSSVPLKITRNQCYLGQLGPIIFRLPILSDLTYV